MSATVKSTLFVWLLLMLGTMVSTWGFSQPTFAADVSTIAVMLISAIKVSLVMVFFMELRSAPWAWRLPSALWVVAATSLVVGIYLL